MNEEEEINQHAIEEGKIKGFVKKETIIALTPEFKTRLQNYLQTKPYNEVSVLVDALKNLQPFEITISG